MKLPESEEGDDDFEDHETYSELIENKDYKGLVHFCLKRLVQVPDDPYRQVYLGDAYVLNGDYEKAIEFITPYLKDFPDIMDFQHVILDSLYKLGKTENDYDWVQKPDIVELNADTVNNFYNLLKPKRKPISIYSLHGDLHIKGYVKFSEVDLLEALKKDGRFTVDPQKDVSVKRKSKKVK